MQIRIMILVLLVGLIYYSTKNTVEPKSVLVGLIYGFTLTYNFFALREYKRKYGI